MSILSGTTTIVEKHFFENRRCSGKRLRRGTEERGKLLNRVLRDYFTGGMRRLRGVKNT
jgi:hypothetical protein